MKIAILSRNKRLYSTQRLIEAAKERGHEVHVVADAVSSRTEGNKQIGLEKITTAGGFITSVETALFEMLGCAEGEAFRKILSLVK